MFDPVGIGTGFRCVNLWVLYQLILFCCELELH